MTSWSPAVRRMGVILAWRPEWPAIVVVAMAWVVLLAVHGVHAAHASAPAQDAHSMPGSHGGPAAPMVLGTMGVGDWALMSVAMMVPATLPAIRHVGLNSIRRRRRWAMAVYVVAYVAVWLAFGIPALLLVAALRAAGADEFQLVSGALLVALLWQLTRWKRRAIVACQRTVPLPPVGWRADYACVRFGVRQAGRCIASCWPLMLVMAAMGPMGHANLVGMAALTAGIVAERHISVRGHFAAPVLSALAVVTIWTVLVS